MKDSELYAVAGMSSSSPAMFERRRRILTEASKLIGRGQVDGFSVRELCERAGVAPNTLYNAFGNKENVIALAISQYFEDFHRNVTFRHAPHSFDGVLEREFATIVRNLSIPAYVRAVAALYFSPSSPSNLRAALVSIAGRPYLPWLGELRASRQLEKNVDLSRVAVNLAALSYAHVQEWQAENLDDDAYVTTRMDAVLSYLGGVTKGDARKAVRALYMDLHGSRTMIDAQVASARELLKSSSSFRKK
ncbi:TetR/AcrR family transcriptional regulator [Sphingobium chlorophenolicum]|uniref:Regulatory protein TetR n=1 Tax=Sphingobium chlorophenolicum TaxID=46429 RepID=A0A081R9Z3_SPHCR|nr:TetR/AcrR family transcriptional regulator [Sphingobium chlorophenolicum]KEQ52016.1 Regulatory protein TetR [Sphingobium chlorophenolicum]